MAKNGNQLRMWNVMSDTFRCSGVIEVNRRRFSSHSIMRAGGKTSAVVFKIRNIGPFLVARPTKVRLLILKRKEPQLLWLAHVNLWMLYEVTMERSGASFCRSEHEEVGHCHNVSLPVAW